MSENNLNELVPVEEPSKIPKWKQPVSPEEKRKRIIMIIVLAAVLFACLVLFRMFKQYSDYNTITSIERMDSEAARFATFGEDIIRYSNDGASLTDVENNVIWSQPFEMQSPIVSIRGEYVAFADQGGKTIYLMNRSGYQAMITTELPIVKADVAEQGNVAVLMKESNVSYLGMYNTSGTKVAEGAIHFESSGFPMDLSLSASGEMMAVSALSIDSGQASTAIYFYSFRSGQQESTDNLVGTLTYDNTVIPRLRYLNNSKLLAFGDNRVVLINGTANPSEDQVINLDKEVKCLFYNDKYFGLLYMMNQQGEGDSADIFNVNGNKLRTVSFDNTYMEAGFMENGEIYLIDGMNCAIYSARGRKKFEGSVDTSLHMVLSTGRYRKYIFVREGKTETVRLKVFS